MALLVQKYGGTSVKDVTRIKAVAERICNTRAAGHDVLVVVSAMSGETNRLERLVEEISDKPSLREKDVVLTTGEQVTIGLLAIALQSMGQEARSYTGTQVKILTDSSFGKARIRHIDDERIRADLTQGRVVIIAGFQGVDETGNITTLGRGGSDTSAVALAAALKAEECQIYTDVDGVYTADPRVVSRARRMDKITFEEMLELASLGSKVLEIRSVEFAGKYNVPLRVLSSLEDGPGTLITYDDNEAQGMEQPLISGVTANRSEAQVTIRGVPDVPGVAARILGPIGDANIEVDMIVQNVGADGTTDFTFTVNRRDFDTSLQILRDFAAEVGAKEVAGNDSVAKVSVVGMGMRSHAGIASTMFRALGAENINMLIISTSEIKISVAIDENYLELALRALHTAFGLDKADDVA